MDQQIQIYNFKISVNLDSMRLFLCVSSMWTCLLFFSYFFVFLKIGAGYGNGGDGDSDG